MNRGWKLSLMTSYPFIIDGVKHEASMATKRRLMFSWCQLTAYNNDVAHEVTYMVRFSLYTPRRYVVEWRYRSSESYLWSVHLHHLPPKLCPEFTMNRSLGKFQGRSGQLQREVHLLPPPTNELRPLGRPCPCTPAIITAIHATQTNKST